MRRFFIFFALVLSLLLHKHGLFAQTYSVGDMIFCMDASGSMNFVLTPNPILAWDDPANLKAAGTPGTRWAFAKQAFQQLMTDVDNIVENYTDPMGAHQRPSDGWVGIIQFPGFAIMATAWTDIFTPSAQIPTGVPQKEQLFHPTIHNQINGFTPRVGIPGTPIGQGLIKSKEQFQVFGAAGASIPNHTPGSRAILLLTDGENNQPPTLTPDWSATFNQVAGVAQNLRVYGIGFGNPADLAATPNELNNISTNTMGAVYFLDPGSSTGASGARATPFELAKEMRDVVIEGTLDFENLVDPTFILKSGESRSFDICVSTFDSTLIISVSVAPVRDARVPEINIHVPGGLTVTPANANTLTQVIYAPKERTQYFNFGHGFLSAHRGDWQVQITAVDSGLHNFGSYGRSGLGFEIRHTLAQPQTGDRVPFEMSFKTGAVTEDSLLALLNKEEPVLGLGNLYAEQLLTPSQMDTVFSFRNNVDFAPAGSKYRYLDAENRVPPPNFSNRTVVFNDQGKDGDRVTSDGIFTWLTEPLVKPEVHKFVFEVRGKTSVAGDTFCRAKTIHFPVQVRVVPDWNVSKIQFVPTESGQGKIVIQPRDTFGNILGPSFSKDFEVQITGGSLTGTFENNLEGNYVQNISYPPGSQPVIRVKYQGKDFPPYQIPATGKSLLCAMSIHYGQLFPVGNMGKLYKDGAASIMVDVEYNFAQSPWNLYLLIGRSQLESDSVGISDDELVSVTLAGRYYVVRSRALRPFIEAGPGYYFFANADDQYGAKVGVGLNVKLSRKLAFEAGSTYHWLSRKDSRFAQAQAGLIYRF